VNIRDLQSKLYHDIEQLKSKEGYLNAGYPRYNTLFGRDSIISAWQMLRIDPSIAKATLIVLSKYQGEKIDPISEEEPGKILHEYRFEPKEQAELPNWKFPYYGSVDSTPLYIILAAEYLRATNDKTFLLGIWKNIQAALDWIVQYGDKDGDGFIEYQRKNPYGLYHQGWKDGSDDSLKIKPPVAIVEAQGYVYAAYYSVVYINQKLIKSKKYSKIMLDFAKKLKDKFNKAFWMDDEKFFALALDGEKMQRTAITSNPGHLLFTEIIDKTKIDYVVKRLFQPDLWTNYGIRTLSMHDPDFDPYSYHLGSIWPHDNWIIYKGLQRLGYHQQAEKIKKALLRAYKKLNKIPELYAVVDDEIIDLSISNEDMHYTRANPVQAWASGALLEMIMA